MEPKPSILEVLYLRKRKLEKIRRTLDGAKTKSLDWFIKLVQEFTTFRYKVMFTAELAGSNRHSNS